MKELCAGTTATLCQFSIRVSTHLVCQRKKCPCVLPNESTLKTTIHLLFVVCYVIFCLHNTAKRTGEKKQQKQNKRRSAVHNKKKHQLVETIVHWICTCILLRNISVFHLLVFARLFSIYYFFLPILLPFSFFCVSLAMCLQIFFLYLCLILNVL